MKKTTTLYIFFLMFPLLCFSQSKKSQGNTISISTTINFFPNDIPFTFSSPLFLQRPDDYILDFSTNTTGTFVLIQGVDQDVKRENNFNVPFPSLGFGMSVQILNEDNLLHEISLTKLSYSKSYYEIFYNFMDSSQIVREPVIGYEQKAFAIGFRYELGKYLTTRKSAKVKFGLSGAIAPSYYVYKRLPSTSGDFPIEAKVFAFDVAFIPMLNAKLSKNVSLDLKLITSMLLGEAATVTQQNPALPPDDQAGTRIFDFPEFGIAFSLGVRYTIKEPKKGRR